MKTKSLSILLLSLFLVGCAMHGGGEENNTPNPTPVNPTPTEVKVTSINIPNAVMEMLVGKKGYVRAIALPANAADRELEYTIVSGNDVISMDDNHLVTALKTGQAKVKVSLKSDPTMYNEAEITVIDQVEHADEAFPIQESSPINYYNHTDLKPTYKYSPSTGKQKLLVIPTNFSDGSKYATAENMEYIRKAYAGTQEEVGWMTFNDYFKNASFGQLEYESHIPDKWFTAPYTMSYYANTSTEDIGALALQWFKTEYPNFDLAPYDADNDGYIDNLHVVYGNKYGSSNSNMWAFRLHNFDEINTTGLKVDYLVFYSVQFLKDTQSGQCYSGVPKDGVSTRVPIHEQGHQLGLMDYYDTAYTGLSLAGTYDMQDHNMMDWNAFSKYAVGWVKPRYINVDYLKEHGSASVILSSSSVDGDCLIVKNNRWSGQPFDEYLMIELFNSNAENNYYDSHWSLSDNANKLTYGVKIYHVDARMEQGYFDDELDRFVTEIVDIDNINREGAANRRVINTNRSKRGESVENAPFNRVGEEFLHYNLLHLLQKGGTNTFGQEDKNARAFMRNDDFWLTGNTFCIGEHEGYRNYGPAFFYNNSTFNDHSELPYGIKFDKVTYNTAKITITYFGE